MNPSDGTAEIRGRVKELLKALPRPVAISREEVFTQRNLWSIEIQSTCEQVIEYYESILMLVDQRLYRPAAALSRSIHEACFRLEYLSLKENELQDWMEWQMSRDYHSSKDFLQYETTVSDSTRRNHEAGMNDLVAAMGEAPKKRPSPWKAIGDILKDISAKEPGGYRQRLTRILYEYPSRFVHIRAGGVPSPEYVVGGARASLLLTIQIAMKLCGDEQLVPTELNGEVDEVKAMCEKLRGI